MTELSGTGINVSGVQLRAGVCFHFSEMQWSLAKIADFFAVSEDDVKLILNEMKVTGDQNEKT